MLAALRVVFPEAEREGFRPAEFADAMLKPDAAPPNPIWQAVAGMVPPPPDAELDEVQLVLAGAILMCYDVRTNCARVAWAWARDEKPPEEPGAPTLARALLERGVAAAHSCAAREGHLGGCSAVLAALKPPLAAHASPAFPTLDDGPASAAALGFLAVSGVLLGGEAQLVVLKSDDIPMAETGGLHLPARLVAEHARSCGEPASRVEILAARKFFPLAPL